MNKAFLDTAYAIALSSKDDSHHDIAVQLADQLEANNTQLVTTHAVMTEIGNALSKQRYRRAAILLLQSIQSDPTIEVIPVTEDLYTQAFALYSQRLDKDWGLTDCISFIVMNDHQLSDALTTDEHFRQAGFRPLLRESSA
jgi:predicted nucleic acid-binding protein